jgi:hypothetical protein
MFVMLYGITLTARDGSESTLADLRRFIEALPVEVRWRVATVRAKGFSWFVIFSERDAFTLIDRVTAAVRQVQPKARIKFGAIVTNPSDRIGCQIH